MAPKHGAEVLPSAHKLRKAFLYLMRNYALDKLPSFKSLRCDFNVNESTV